MAGVEVDHSGAKPSEQAAGLPPFPLLHCYFKNRERQRRELPAEAARALCLYSCIILFILFTTKYCVLFVLNLSIIVHGLLSPECTIFWAIWAKMKISFEKVFFDSPMTWMDDVYSEGRFHCKDGISIV